MIGFCIVSEHNQSIFKTVSKLHRRDINMSLEQPKTWDITKYKERSTIKKITTQTFLPSAKSAIEPLGKLLHRFGR
jgi:hypothetical protein